MQIQAKKTIKKLMANYNLKKAFKKTGSGRIIYIGSPTHGNLGDHAISISILKLLEKYNKNVVEVPGEWYMYSENFVKQQINEDDVIILTGGGLIGTIWMNEQNMIKSVLKNFPSNKIIIMPQTYYFSDSHEGKKELEKFKSLVCSNKNIYLCARDKFSYEFCKTNFNAKKVYFLPDVVLTLKHRTNFNRDGILFIIRDDKEKLIQENDILQQTKLDEEVISYTSTVLPKRIYLSEREALLKNKLDEISRYGLVITDRLHGMIFSAITGTPCIALNNSSGKVKGVYEHIKSLQYIRFCEDIADIDKIIREIKVLKNENDYLMAETFKQQIENVLDKLI